MPNLLTLEKVSSAYAQSKVLWDIDMDIPQGSAVALIGRNGVGKSTLLNTIAGVQKLTGGRISFNGADVSSASAHARARAGIGLVPQGRHVFPQLSVIENLTVGLAALTGRKAVSESGIASHIFELFPKLTEIKNRKAGLLSGGEQQQLAIGRALAGQPKLLLLDEPTEGIQPNVVQQIEAALRRVRSELGVTILIIEQYLDFAWSFAEQYHVMQRGKIIRSGNTAEESAASVSHLVNI